MEGQLQQTHHRYEDDPHHHAVVEGEGEAEHHNHHGEKKSVLTKVKNKAKKIKDKIKHAGHAHEGDDYDYDEDEEIVNAPHVHGAPIVNDSEFISGTALPKQTGLILESPVNPLVDGQSRTARDGVYDDVGANMASDRNARNEMYSSIGNDQVIENSPLLEDPYIPNDRKEEYSEAGDVGEIMARLAMEAPRSNLADPPPERRSNVVEPVVKIGPLTGLEEDPHFPRTHHHLHPPNYETKVSDPTGQGGAEVDIAPLVDRLGNLHVGDECESKTESEEMDYTGSHDQFAPQPILISEQFNPKSLDDDSMLPQDKSVIADKASSAKDMVASKLGYDDSSQVVEEPARKGALESVSEYGHVVVEKLAPVYEKAAGAGTAIMSKMQRGGGGVAEESDRGVSVQEYLVEKFRPGEEDRELSKVISSAIRGEGQQHQQQQQPAEVKESIRVEAVVSDEKAAVGVVDRVKGAIGSWLGKNPRGHPGEGAGEGLEKEIASKLQE